MMDGAITRAYEADRERVLEVLNEALATEFVCTLRYKSHYDMAIGMFKEPVVAGFLQHAAEEQEHADLICERITQLGGQPNLNAVGLADRIHSPSKRTPRLSAGSATTTPPRAA